MILALGMSVGGCEERRRSQELMGRSWVDGGVGKGRVELVLGNWEGGGHREMGKRNPNWPCSGNYILLSSGSC